MFLNWKTILLNGSSRPTIYRLSEIPIKIPTPLFIEMKITYPKVPVEMQGTQNSQKSWKGKIKLKYTFTDFKTYSKERTIFSTNGAGTNGYLSACE